MLELAKSKCFIFFLIGSFVLFSVPGWIQAKEAGQGNLVGYVYGPDNTSPVEGAVVKLRNLSTGSLYESMAADDEGMVRFEDIDEGLYLVGISTAKGDFNIENLVGVKSGETAAVSFALRQQEQEGTAQETSKRCPRGKWYVPEVKGQCDDNYQWNPETERCECKKRNPLAFFLTPLGSALVLAASGGVIAFSLAADGEPPASPFR